MVKGIFLIQRQMKQTSQHKQPKSMIFLAFKYAKSKTSYSMVFCSSSAIAISICLFAFPSTVRVSSKIENARERERERESAASTTVQSVWVGRRSHKFLNPGHFSIVGRHLKQSL